MGVTTTLVKIVQLQARVDSVLHCLSENASSSATTQRTVVDEDSSAVGTTDREASFTVQSEEAHDGSYAE